ncbi:MAG: hypothetical protein ACOZNI_18740 [Myxococcota bacterium]
MWILLCALTDAGTYTVDDLGRAVQRGLPEPTLETIAGEVGPLDGEGVVTLLRYGVDPAWIRARTGDAHPTPDELAAAAAAGPIEPPPAEFVGLSDAAWRALVGADVVLRAETGVVEGRIAGFASGVLTLVTADGPRQVATADVATVRRVDGAPIPLLRQIEREAGPADAALQRPALTRVGRGLFAGGLGGVAVGTLAIIAANAEADAAVGSIGSGDGAGGVVHGVNTVGLGLVGFAGLFVGGQATIAGAVMLAIGDHQMRQHREDP